MSNSIQSQFSQAAQDGIIALGKVHLCSALLVGIFPKEGLKIVPMLVILNTDHFRPPRGKLATPLSFVFIKCSRLKPVGCASADSVEFHFSSRWHRSAQKGLYVLYSLPPLCPPYYHCRAQILPNLLGWNMGSCDSDCAFQPAPGQVQ